MIYCAFWVWNMVLLPFLLGYALLIGLVNGTRAADTVKLWWGVVEFTWSIRPILSRGAAT